jgi:DNA repair protein RecO (recombination protein O)
MLHQTRGIVLHHFRYSETSVIAKVYTEKFGLQSYLIRGVRSPKAKIKPGLLEHLSLLDMVVYYREGRGLQNIKEVRQTHAFKSMHTDIRKSSQALFMNEVIYKSVKEEESNAALFDFLYNSVVELDKPDMFSANFHLDFMVNLARFLGFAPTRNYVPGSWFNLQEGYFEEQRPVHSYFIFPEHAVFFNALLNQDSSHTISSDLRKLLLHKLIEFYELHLPSFERLNSPEVLHEVLRE